MEGQNKKVEEPKFKEAPLRFCPSCANKMTVTESAFAQKVVYFCGLCKLEEPCEYNCVYFRNYKPNYDQKISTICRTIDEDPTRPRLKKKCPKCSFEEATVFHYTQNRVAFVCRSENCRHHWIED